MRLRLAILPANFKNYSTCSCGTNGVFRHLINCRYFIHLRAVIHDGPSKGQRPGLDILGTNFDSKPSKSPVKDIDDWLGGDFSTDQEIESASSSASISSTHSLTTKSKDPSPPPTFTSTTSATLKPQDYSKPKPKEFVPAKTLSHQPSTSHHRVPSPPPTSNITSTTTLNVPKEVTNQLYLLTDKISTAIKDIHRLQDTFTLQVEDVKSQQLADKQRILAIKENDLEARTRDLSSERTLVVREKHSLSVLVDNCNKLTESLIEELSDCRKQSEDQSRVLFDRFEQFESRFKESLSLMHSERQELSKSREELMRVIHSNSEREVEYRNLIDDYAHSKVTMAQQQAELNALKETLSKERHQINQMKSELAEERSVLDTDVAKMTEISLEVKRKSEEIKEEQDKLNRDYGHCETLVNDLRIAKRDVEDQEASLADQRDELKREERKIAQLRIELKAELEVLEKERDKVNRAMKDYRLMGSHVSVSDPEPEVNFEMKSQSQGSKPHGSKSRSLMSSVRLQKLKEEALREMEKDKHVLQQQRDYLSSSLKRKV
ncbi:hypothetical protein GEMRC1_005739 [Eukaryota sp. GEM-RC1]